MKILGKNIQLRTADISDAEFILELRTQTEKTKYLSQVDNDLAKQQAWLKSYKQKELNQEEFYFVIESKENEKLGLVRVYDLQPDSFCWGSWLIKDGAPVYTAIESMMMIYEFGFKDLNQNMARIDVRNENKNVLAIHRNFGASIVKVTKQDTFFEITKDTYFEKKNKFKSFLVKN